MGGLKKPKFRSHREKVGYYTYTIGVGLPIVILAALLDAGRFTASTELASRSSSGRQYVGWLVWLAWGRERFPLRSPDESPNP